MEDLERETTTTEAKQSGLKEDELELSLGLRPATIRRHFHPKIPIPEGSGDLRLMTVPILGKGEGVGSENDSEGLGFEFEAKKEAQALRRQEARKKREEKRKFKANAVAGNFNGRVLWFEKQRAAGREREIEDDFSERRRKWERNCNNNEAEGIIPAATTSKPPGFVNENQLNGMSYYMIMPGLVGSDGNAVNPVAGAGDAGGFRPYHHVPEKNSGNGGCSRGSSPGVSDYRSTSGQGGSSSDGGSHSSHSHSLEPTTTDLSPSVKPAPKPEAETEPSPTPCKNPQRSRSPANETKGVVVNPSKPPKPPAAAQQTNNNEAMLLSQSPYVFTTGNGPNGKTITGFLYKYTNSEVCIVCVCHGTSFTPAGFVEHAGGVDIVNPLRHITVVPFAFT
ncbi:hypothetical protein V2J09_000960 [Rumex salicifolius]